MMKKIPLISALFAFTFSLTAQVFKVGDVNCNYKSVNHNYTVSCPQYTAASESYTLDFDNDLVSDMNITSSCQWYFNSTTGWFNIQRIYVTPSSGYQVVSDGMGGIINVAQGTVMNNSLGFTPSSGYLLALADPYLIGFRKLLSGDTLYGWVKINYSSLPGAIRSYGYKLASDNSQPTIAFTNTQTTLCTGESLTLTAQPGGGMFSGTNVTGDVFSPTSSGIKQVVYTYTNSTGCNVSIQMPFTVSACVGINEIQKREHDLNVFPNPTNGEFEIKGTKEELIYITNQLGQLIETKKLNSENSYAVKINDLSGGIYFVGNKISKHKIVVIK